MQWSDIPRQPDNTMLRRFAALCLVCFATLAVWQAFFRGNSGWGLLWLGMALGVGATGILWPAAVRRVYVGWMMAVFPIGWAVSWLLLALLFYGVLTPVGLLFRISGRDLLCRRSDPNRTSFWVLKPAAPDPVRYFQQF